jgi:hypothetical protein
MVIEDLPASPTTQLWRCVEQELIHPWFYLQIGRWARTESSISMMMIHHAHELRELVDRQSNLIWIEQVQFVSPPHVNGLSMWMMEPLLKVVVLALPGPENTYGLRVDVAGGRSYFINGADQSRSEEVVNVLFDAKGHLYSC